MKCFEGVKRDFGRNEERDLVELRPLRLDTEDSFCYDEEERMVILTQCVVTSRQCPAKITDVLEAKRCRACLTQLLTRL